MTEADQRYVRNRTDGEVFIKGHGVVPGGFEGFVPDDDAVSALVGAHVLADVKVPDGAPLTSKQQAAAEAEGLGIEFDYDNVTEKQLRDLIKDKEGGDESA